MARHESDRDDLFAEAVALVCRVRWRSGDGREAVAGFRANGWFSLYLGQDWMTQVDEQGRLRRAYRHGTLYRTYGDGLAAMVRERTSAETLLVRRDLGESELASFLNDTRGAISRFLDELRCTPSIWTLTDSSTDDAPTSIVVALESLASSPLPLAPAIAPR